MILIAGGTGRLGTHLVTALRADGQPVRVLTRDPRRAEPLRHLGVQIAAGDVRDPATLTAAVAGVRTIVSAVHGFARHDGGTPGNVDRDGNLALVDAAAQAGADVVLLSVLGAAPDHPLPLFRMKAAAEEHLRARLSGSTILRCAPFVELHLDVLAKTAGPRRAPTVLGRGDNPFNVVSVKDVARAVLAAVAGGFPGQILDVGGPGDVTVNHLAEAVRRRLGRTDQRIRHVPRGLLRVLAATERLPRVPIGQIAALALAVDTLPMTYDALHHTDAIEWRGTVHPGDTPPLRGAA
jgi:uncharacterized protein YbjT (DUF2867 family)